MVRCFKVRISDGLGKGEDEVNFILIPKEMGVAFELII